MPAPFPAPMSFGRSGLWQQQRSSQPSLLLRSARVALGQMVFLPPSSKAAGRLPLGKATRAEGSNPCGFHACYALEGAELGETFEHV